MIKTLTITSLVAASFATSALAGNSHRRAAPDAASFYATYDRQVAAPAAAAPQAREDFGSYGAAATARSLGY